MSTNSTENGSADSENSPYNVEVLRELLPTRLGGEGMRAAICAIRNPDANTSQIAAKAGVASTYTVGNALRSLLRGEAPDYSASATQVHERRGSTRDAESYEELTEKQQAVVDFAARHPEYVEEHTYADIAERIHERDGTSVGETYVGHMLRKYPEVLHQRRAQVAVEDSDDEALEQATQDMTVREVLEAAGYDLPDENLDDLPERGPETDSEGRQATLGETHEAEAEQGEQGFQAGSEYEQEQQEQRERDAERWLSEAWCDWHAHLPGAGQAVRLPEDADDDMVKQNTPYWSYVNGVAPYGVFVSLTRPAHGDDVSGLVTVERMYGKKDDLERGDPLIVELHNQNVHGLAFTDWRLTHPDEAQEQQAAGAADEADTGEAQEAEAVPTEDSEAGDGEDEGTVECPHCGKRLALDGKAANRILAGHLTHCDEYDAEAQEAAEQEAAEQEAAEQEAEAAPAEQEAAEFEAPLVPEDLDDRLEDVERAVDGLRQDSVFAQEMKQFADQVEGRLDDLAEQQADLDDAEERMYETLQNSVAKDTVERAEAAEQKAATLQEMVNSLAERVEQATSVGGTLGRVQEDVQRLAGEGGTATSYSYQRQGGTVSLRLQVDVQEAEAERRPECHQCGAPLPEGWNDAEGQPPKCPQCGENPLPPVGSSEGGEHRRIVKEDDV